MARSFLVKPDNSNLVIGVDFGYGDDVSVETIIKRNMDGTVKIISQKIIGRAPEFNEERINQYINELENK